MRFAKDELITNLMVYCVMGTGYRGGHFLELEEPELVARDPQTFFGALLR